MCKFAIGICLEFGVFLMMYGSTGVVGLRRVEFHCFCRVRSVGFIICRRAHGVLFLVYCWRVRGLSCNITGAIGFVVVVIGGAAATLWSLVSPSEVVDSSTLWMCGGSFFSLCNAISIFLIVLIAYSVVLLSRSARRVLL